MARREVETLGLGSVAVTRQQQRKAAVHIADRIAAEHPHPLDESTPHLAGQLIAKDPTARADLLQLLDAIGYRKEKRT